jgi:DNA-directed RNA polymerase specialized sigma24 family protein
LRKGTQAVALEGVESSDTTTVLASSQHRLELLDDCLKRLSAKETRLKEAVYDQQRSLIEVAKSTQQSHDAVLKQVSRLRAKLRDCIESKEL